MVDETVIQEAINANNFVQTELSQNDEGGQILSAARFTTVSDHANLHHFMLDCWDGSSDPAARHICISCETARRRSVDLRRFGRCCCRGRRKWRGPDHPREAAHTGRLARQLHQI